MRNVQKQEILDCIESLHQAHKEIKNALNGGDYDLVQRMLSQCQEFAISLGETIEKLEGEGHTTVVCLEEYCETLYHVYEELGSCGAGSGKIYKILRRRLLEVESSVKNDIQIRKEVVFLPYKASMWDSLESVWKAADEDPDCDAYVIPIPYYDKNSEESFGERHYEADLYPAYVPVVSYKSYDFEKRRPDMIFIHNPYDEYNFVTSVDPFFYSKNLKRFTEELIYIPYFLLDEIKPDDEEAIKGMTHFCTIPGVLNADKVIVQSEDMRQIYVNELSVAAGEHTRNYWQKKILGLGSPKVDRATNTKKEDLEIPEEWMKIISKPDGGWKKVIFYNTGVSELLADNEKLFEKMKYIFRVFKEQQEDVALLWRPHPLLPGTIKAMRPQLWEEYEQIVEQYQKEGWGIYDESADIDRAVAVSDSYYGGRSSVVQLYQAIGKPAMIRSLNCETFNWNGIFGTYKIVGDGGKAWIAAALFNGLFSIDLKSGEIDWKGKFPKEKDDVVNLFRDYIVAEDKIYFVPSNAEHIAIYDIAEEKFEAVGLDTGKYKKNGNYASIMQNGRELLFIGMCRTNAICRFSMDTGKIVFIGSEDAEQIDVGPYGELYGRRHCIWNNVLYIPLRKGGCALKVNLLTEETELLRLTEKEDAAFSMAVYIPQRNAIWFVDMCGHIVQWNETTKEKEIIKFSDCSEEAMEEYCTCERKENKLYLFPGKCEVECKCIDLYTCEIESFQSPIQVLDIEEIEGKKYYLGSKKNGKFYITHMGEKGMKEMEIHRRDHKTGRKCLDEYQIHISWEKAPLYFESNVGYVYRRNLEMYIEWVAGGADGIEGDNRTSIGNRIWNRLGKRISEGN